MSSKVVTPELARLAVNTIGMLAVDAVEKAKSGHPGMPMGAADYAFILWSKVLRFNPKDPDWPNRDRFVLSAGHGSMLLYGLLYLSGFDVHLEDLQQFRQWESRTPGHPEYGCLPGVETTTGPLGQGFGNGVGMAVAAKMMAERFNTPDFSVIDHRIYGIVSDGDLMEGVSAETASLAGHLGLGNLIYFYDDNHISIEGSTGLTFSEEVSKRFEAYGWEVIPIDGHDHGAIEQAIERAQAETERPSLIQARTHIAKGSPHKHDTAEAHGSPLGPEEVIATKENLGWPSEPTFLVPDEVKALFADRVAELRQEYGQWQERFSAWADEHPDLAERWEAHRSKAVPDDMEIQLLKTLPGKTEATRNLSGAVIQQAAEVVPALCGGAADLDPSTKTAIKSASSIAPGAFGGRNFHFGVREHAMGAILNGLSLYGGFIPYGGTFLVFSDYMRPPIRLAAMMGIQVIYVFTHDSIFLGEDGPTHQPIEQLTALRAIPNLTVIRPADGVETALAWAWALKHQTGPTALILTRQDVPLMERARVSPQDLVERGGYVLSEAAHDNPDLVLVATGSEVTVALDAKEILMERGYAVRVVSMPSVEIFETQPLSYQESVLPSDVRIVAIETGRSDGWYKFVGHQGLVIGMDRFGASAPYEVLAEKFGFTGQQVAERVMTYLR